MRYTAQGATAGALSMGALWATLSMAALVDASSPPAQPACLNASEAHAMRMQLGIVNPLKPGLVVECKANIIT
jgi:hypothetical protein